MRISRSLFILAVPLLAASAAAHASDVSDRDSDQTVAADPHGVVEVSNFGGRVEVSAWDQPQVSVHTFSSNDVTNVDVRTDHGRTTIKVRLHGFFSGGDADLKIKIPKSSELDVTTVSADVISIGVLGAQRLKTVSGRIRADIAGDVEAKTVSGDVTLRGAGKTEELHASSISGSIRLEHGAGDVEATTVSGVLDVELEPGRMIRARTTSGPMYIRGKLAKDADLDLQTVSGNIRLHAGAEGGLDYEASTFSGSIRNCFNAQTERTSQYGPGERLVGTLGKGGARAWLKTMSGGIDLCDRP
jgi:DUF4097 and DUF4098 domain-containing protein YvlB